MTDRLRIALAQMNQRVGDLEGNAAAMLEMRRRAEDADLLLCPELQLIGYPPEDLVLKPEFVRRTHECTDELVAATTKPGPAMLIGTILSEGGSIYNALILADGGRVVGRTLKHELPNYGTFDEKRIFTPGPLPEPMEFKGIKIGVPICEDIWREAVCAHLVEAGAEMLLVPNGSPYELDKDETRYRLVRSRALETSLPLAYLNRVGGQDEIVFDGSSFVVHPDGERVVQMCDWDEALLITEWERTVEGWRCTTREAHELDAFPEDVYRAMMMGLHDYVERNGFPGVILGLSGGIDSALSAAVAVDSLGPGKVWGVMLPSKYTSDESLEDARECARLLGCRHDVVSIAPARGRGRRDASGHERACRRERPGAPPHGGADGAVQFGRPDAADYRQQERDERRLCHALRRHGGRLFGAEGRLQDDCLRAVALAQREQAGRRAGPDGPVMPERVITKPPTAELRPGQKDEDSLAALFGARPNPRRPGRQGDVGVRSRRTRPARTWRWSPTSNPSC